MNRPALLLVLIVSAAFLFQNLNEPLMDGMAVKQIFVAHKARSIAGPPFDLTRNTFDFLEHDGRRLVLTEEVPLYAGLVAAGYRLFGEHEWIGRLISIIATLIAILALHDLVRRDVAESLAVPAAAIFAFTPLLRVYGQTVQPDACMLACMLLSACAWSRFLERRSVRWWLTALLALTLGAMFKYYALIAIVPLAFQAIRAGADRRAAAALTALGAFAVVPIAIWVTCVFAPSPNPTGQQSYFLFQMPELVFHKTLYLRFFDRFLYKDCGPVATIFMGLGVWAAFRRTVDVKPIAGWTIAGFGFYLLMGPMLRCHDYYEMTMLPAAAVWAAVGWHYTRLRFALALLILVVIHSPWVLHHKSVPDPSCLIASHRVAELVPPGSRFAVVAGDNGVALVHYARREGWIAPHFDSLEAGRTWLDHCRNMGAEHALIFRDRTLKPLERAMFAELAAEYSTVVHAVDYDVVRLERPPSPSARR